MNSSFFSFFFPILDCEPLQIWMLLKHGSISPPKYWSMRLKDDNNMEIIKRDLAHSKGSNVYILIYIYNVT